MNTSPEIEAIKEGLRVVVLAIIPILISGMNSITGEININWRVVAVVGALTLLRFIDKYLHELGKVKKENGDKNNSLLKGLTQF